MKQKRGRRAASPAQLAGQVMASLFEVTHGLGERVEQALGEVRLSWAKYEALGELDKAGEPLNLGGLAERLTCGRSNITQLVDRMEADGLVRRVDDPTDRRSLHAAITALGRERYAAGTRKVERVQRELAKSLSAPDRAALQRVLSKIK
jgi:DNA-binding MarR family transcriptional regulator